MIKLALLRHGHTEWNHAGRIQGRTDVPLEAEAAAALAALELPANWRNAALVASPLNRAVQTAELVAQRAPTKIASLMEMDWGDWEGLRGVDLREQTDGAFRDIEHWGWNYTPPNGESPAQIAHRLTPWLTTLSTDTVAVCHIGIMRVLLAQATGWNFDGPAPFRIKRNRLFILNIDEKELTFEPEQPRLVERVL
ncbi:MAG: histidine phosphatase family protein [Sulfitobacter sp.]